ncbi:MULTISPECIES: DUF2089 domain-containing protein [Caloramator]|jgi:hypothetical protein|uniref:DUF2089 domain-containing protein n=1 Tax=Caloramator australicus RC3 TaxID=857293 RepID=I7LKV2_9CLOT|nr:MULTISPECIES: DUF2089 domain-containing protein [Caloramator]MDO6353946.1 DUF2089 domain-containing protein [Caloramator sp. CAR-1]CCJ34740.1 hypothetical protein CAAU_2657 [Caloramator australicus RC3]
MGYKIITRCPVCDSKLKITRLSCKKCGTTIENEFELSNLSYLTKEQLDFVEVFIKCRGNIKDVEKELSISYPTVRSKLDEVILALGYPIKQKSEKEKDVLDMLEKGEITPDEAIKMLKD